MNAVGLALVWCVLQVTLVGLFAAVLYGAVHRLRPAAAGPVAMAALVVVVGLSVLALSPWPQWRFSSHRGEEAGAAAETTVAAGSDLSAARDALAGNAAAPASQDTAPAAGRFSIAVALVQALVAEMGRLDAAPHEAVWRWPAIVAVVLVSGMGCGLVWLILGAFAVRKERVRSAVVADADLREEIDIVCAELGCVRPIEVHQGNGLSTAATIGWRRPVILLPEDWRSWTAAQRRAVLAHEIAQACAAAISWRSSGRRSGWRSTSTIPWFIGWSRGSAWSRSWRRTRQRHGCRADRARIWRRLPNWPCERRTGRWHGRRGVFYRLGTPL